MNTDENVQKQVKTGGAGGGGGGKWGKKERTLLKTKTGLIFGGNGSKWVILGSNPQFTGRIADGRRPSE